MSIVKGTKEFDKLPTVNGADVLTTDSVVDELSDIDTTTAAPSVGDRLEWNGTNWVPVGDDASQIAFAPDGDIAATDAQAAVVEVRDDADTKLAGKANTSHTHAAADIDSGTLGDARVAESNVTQHVAAINHDALLNSLADEHRTILQDLEASKPTAAIAGRFYYATDTKKLYYDNATSWDLVVATPDTHIHAADDLSDVDTTTAAPSVGDRLEWNGTNWVPTDPAHLIDDLTKLILKIQSYCTTKEGL